MSALKSQYTINTKFVKDLIECFGVHPYLYLPA